jgi:hypothetical protein
LGFGIWDLGFGIWGYRNRKIDLLLFKLKHVNLNIV